MSFPVRMPPGVAGSAEGGGGKGRVNALTVGQAQVGLGPMAEPGSRATDGDGEQKAPVAGGTAEPGLQPARHRGKQRLGPQAGTHGLVEGASTGPVTTTRS